MPDSRLVDEFRADALARGLAVPGEVGVSVTFADLEWEPFGAEGESLDDTLAARERDPAFTVTGYSRWVAFARIRGEIRYWAAPIPEGAPAWWWTGEDPARRAAVEAEPEQCELAVLGSVADAVTLTAEYLGGAPLGEIRVARTPPPWATRQPVSPDGLASSQA
jgi:hypothetical protein